MPAKSELTAEFRLARREGPRVLASWTRISLWSDYLLVTALHGWLLYYGISSVVTTLLGYLTMALALKLLARVVSFRSSVGSKGQGVASVLVWLFLVELVLRYGVATRQSYRERNGSFYHYSLYEGDGRSNYNRRVLGLEDRQLHVRRPNSSVVFGKNEFSFRSDYNSLGLREAKISSGIGSNEFRIVALGDSFTEGVGAAQGSSWPRHLERALRREYQDIELSVINGGVAGSDPLFGYILLERKLSQYHPGLVVVALNTSDISDIILRGGKERFRADGSLRYRRGPWWEPLYSISYIVRHWAHDVWGLNWWLMSSQETKDERSRALVEISRCMGDFVNFAALHDVAVLVVVHPMHHEVLGDSREFEQLLMAARSVAGVEVLDLRQYFLRNTDLADNLWAYYWRVDRHHNEKGYRLFAEGVMRQVVASDIIPNE